MSWTFSQRTGQIKHNGHPVGSGYSGRGAGLHNPAMEMVTGTGPIPQGEWHIGPAHTHSGKGHVVMSLTPVGHLAYYRDHFLIHGDNKKLNHTASHGCIILGAKIRKIIAHSHDEQLFVVP